MSKITILLLFISVIIAGGLTYFQYYKKAKNKLSLNLFLAFLRFFTYLIIFILLINPIINRKSYEVKKISLPVFVDNSSSINEFDGNQKVNQIIQKIKNNDNLNEKFNIQYFSFDKEVKLLDSLNFKGKQTHIDKVAKEIKQLFRNENLPLVLLTDGNQTIGNDYVFNFPETSTIYPIVIGDTTTVFDIKINQVNVNKYAFLKNKFPVEIFTQYNGNKNVTATVSISSGENTISKQNITFSPQNKAQNLSFLLDANSIGLKKYTVTISSNSKEKNTKNNSKPFIVEIIDQQTEIALIADVNHPDLGVLKRSIELNEQRKVTIINSNNINNLEKFNIIIFYQPTTNFKSIIERCSKLNQNQFIITGTATDYNFLNQVFNDFSFKMSGQNENYLADFSTNFNAFNQNNIGFENFPPLENKFGTISSKKSFSTLLNAKIRNTILDFPLLSFIDEKSSRKAYLFGEGLWKWRMDYYKTHQNFTDFDLFIDKTIQYLNSNSSKRSLVVETESYYNSGEPITIKAQYFNKNYEFDNDASLEIKVINTTTKQTKTYAFATKQNEYEVNFDGLNAGKYNYLVTEKKSNTKISGSFEVLDFDIEKQFVNPDYSRLSQLANATNGKVILANEFDKVFDELLQNDLYKPVEKEIIKREPLINWKWLLLLIVLLLATEWFTRKYNGLN